MKLTFFNCCFLAAFVCQGHGATFGLNKIFGSNMVLIDSPRQAKIFGFGEVGMFVSAAVDGVDMATEAVGADEQFSVTLPPFDAGGPHIITVSHGSDSVTLDNVMFGEVWLCSGQSNMEFGMREIYNATEEIADAVNFPDIRVVRVTKVTAQFPQNDLQSIDVTWRSPETNTGTFGITSSLCFLTARELQKKHGKPIGAISDSWGGTRVEAWSSPSALAACGVTETTPENPGANDASALWNSMIHPLLKMPITGALWYQGESNVGSPNYDCTFPSMIDDWRSSWSEATGGLTDATFPFGFIQLATTGAGNFNYGYQRWKQTANYGFVPNPRMVNVVMATGLDLEDDNAPTGAIHPRDKQTLAYRLSWALFNQYYGLTEYPLRGPEVTGVSVEGNTATISYDQDIITKGTTGFHAKCGSSRAAAPVVSQTSNSVTIDITPVSSCAPGGLELEYGWDSRPCDYKTCAVYSAGSFDLTQSAWQTIL